RIGLGRMGLGRGGLHGHHLLAGGGLDGHLQLGGGPAGRAGGDEAQQGCGRDQPRQQAWELAAERHGSLRSFWRPGSAGFWHAGGMLAERRGEIMEGSARPAGGTPVLIASEIYRHSSYGSRHPLAIPRVSTAVDLCRALGWLPAAAYLDSPVATPAELTRFHTADYVAAVAAAEATQAV